MLVQHREPKGERLRFAQQLSAQLEVREQVGEQGHPDEGDDDPVHDAIAVLRIDPGEVLGEPPADEAAHDAGEDPDAEDQCEGHAAQQDQRQRASAHDEAAGHDMLREC